MNNEKRKSNMASFKITPLHLTESKEEMKNSRSETYREISIGRDAGYIDGVFVKLNAPP